MRRDPVLRHAQCLAVSLLLAISASASPTAAGLSKNDQALLVTNSTSFWSELMDGDLASVAGRLDTLSQQALANRYRAVLSRCVDLVPKEDLTTLFMLDGGLEESLQERDPIKFFARVSIQPDGKRLQRALLEELRPEPTLVALAGGDDTAYLIFENHREVQGPGFAKRTVTVLTTIRAAREDDGWDLELPEDVLNKLVLGSEAARLLLSPAEPTARLTQEDATVQEHISCTASNLTEEDQRALTAAADLFWKNLKGGALDKAAAQLDEKSRAKLASWSRSIASTCHDALGNDSIEALYESKRGARFAEWLARSKDEEILSGLRLVNFGPEFQNILLDRYSQGPKLLSAIGTKPEAYLIFGHKTALEPRFAPDRLTSLRAVWTKNSWRLQLPGTLLDQIEVGARERLFLESVR